MHSRINSGLLAVAVAVVVASGGCAVEAPPPGEEPPAGRTSYRFEPITVSGVTPRWGATVSGAHLLGGVDDSMAVSDEVLSVAHADEAMQGATIGALDVPRFCGCAFFDEGRRELVVLGGRDDFFRDETTAMLINVDTGEPTALEQGGAADHPVGCMAFFSSSTDRGYVFGGANQSGFSSDTWRYDPEARSFTRLDIAGPSARYDGGVVSLADGGALLASGMGMGAFSVTFFRDVWRFNAASESWSEVVASSPEAPTGRRYPWLALAPDETTLLFGFGSDSPRGESVLGDLFTVDLATGTWSAAEVEGELPSARGFTFRLPGPAGSAGMLAFGSDADLNIQSDAFALVVPDDLAGEWR